MKINLVAIKIFLYSLFNKSKSKSKSKSNFKTKEVMFNYGIGGQEVKQDASEAMADLPLNRTMFVQKLTQDDPIKPQAVYDLKTVDEVFEHFKPNVDVEFMDSEGNSKEENIRYANLGDFSANNLVKQSSFLQDLNMQQEQYQKIIKQLKTNKVMGKILENPEAKNAFISLLNSLIQEVENADSK